MKVILTDDIKKVGKKHDIIEVKSGFAHNFLIPQKKAIVATPEAQAQIESMRAQSAAERAAKKSEFETMFKAVAGQTLTMNAKVNEQGGLYEAIDAEAVTEALNAAHNVSLDADMIELEAPLKETGEFNVKLTFDDLAEAFTLIVAAEEVAE